MTDPTRTAAAVFWLWLCPPESPLPPRGISISSAALRLSPPGAPSSSGAGWESSSGWDCSAGPRIGSRTRTFSRLRPNTAGSFLGSNNQAVQVGSRSAGGTGAQCPGSGPIHARVVACAGVRA